MALDAVEGLIQALQILVMCLGKSGQLDTAEYARLLADWRLAHVPPDSMQEAVLDRMLSFLVDEPEVLLRRLSLQVVQGESHGQMPNAEAVRQKHENDL